jgi:HPt (histidine-containing phosphotransfer) domain-containing protein
MPMALKADISVTCEQVGTQKPVDLVYLSSQTMGDRNLEREILGMFASQLPEYVLALQNGKSADEIFAAAHMLKGAARSVGAEGLAKIAKEFEENSDTAITQLQEEARKVQDYIAALGS